MDMGHMAALAEASGELAFGMAWSVLWSLILGFVLSGLIQSLVSQSGLQRLLGSDRPRALGLAALFGAASSSCSYASAAISRSLFSRGASFSAAMAFLIASTNLVVELGLVLWLLMGWQFTLAEWLGGLVMIGVMAVLVRLTAPPALIEQARAHAREAAGHRHEAGPVAGATLLARLRNPDLPVRVAQSFAADLRMLWKDLVLGFVIAGVLGAVVPAGWWAALFLHGATSWLRIPADALLAPLIAMISFVCSIGNVPMAAVLWGSGIGFGGVLAFLYADLIVLPLLDVYRRAYGAKMAAYMAAILYATMVISGLIMQAVFHLSALVPPRVAFHAGQHMGLHFDATAVANLLAIAGAVALFVTARRHPAMAKHCCGRQRAPAE
jgi:uncharacterized membrane protein YraQ (UPF0718 family)